MPRILSLETSTSVCSAAIHEDGKLIAVSEIHEDQAHAAKLALLIEDLLKITGVTPGSLDAVALSSGPGSYTGLRIGTSMAKGLCYSGNLPLVAVNALQLMAYRIVKSGVFKGMFCPMLDARRMEVYYTLFDTDLQQVTEIKPHVVNEESFSGLLDQREVCFFGPGLEKCRDVIRHRNAKFVSGIYPSAAELGELGALKLSKGEIENLERFEPIYLKEFLAKKSTKMAGVLNK